MGDASLGTHAKHHVRPKIAGHDFPQLDSSGLGLSRPSNPGGPNWLDCVADIGTNGEGATLGLARLLAVKVWA